MDTNISKKWMDTLKDALLKYSDALICSLHFHKTDIIMKRINGKTYVKLKNDAIPKITSIDPTKMDV